MDKHSTDPRARRSPFASGNAYATGLLLALGALTAFGIAAALGTLNAVLVQIVLALFICLGLDPVVRVLELRGLSRAWAIVVVSVALVALVAGVVWLVVPPVVTQIVAFAATIPQFVTDLTTSDVFLRVESALDLDLDALLDQGEAFLSDPANILALFGGAVRAGTGLANGISGVVVVLVLTLYFLATLRPMKEALYRFAPARRREGIRSVTEEITESVGGYLGGMVILAAMNAVFVLIVHLVMGLNFPVLMAAVAFGITLIPLVGSVLFWVIGTLMALFLGPVQAIVFAVVYLIYVQVEAYVLTPRVMSRVIQIPGVLVVISALVGATLLGLIGALIAVPVTAGVLVVVRRVVYPRQDAKV